MVKEHFQGAAYSQTNNGQRYPNCTIPNVPDDIDWERGYTFLGKVNYLTNPSSAEECRIYAKNNGYKAWGWVNNCEKDENKKNRCFAYNYHFEGIDDYNNKDKNSDKIFTGCVNPGEKVGMRCDPPAPVQQNTVSECVALKTEKDKYEEVGLPMQLPAGISKIKGWTYDGRWDLDEKNVVYDKNRCNVASEEDCRRYAQENGYKAWAYRSENNNWWYQNKPKNNTCVMYNDNFKGMQNIQDKDKDTTISGCVFPGGDISNGCEPNYEKTVEVFNSAVNLANESSRYIATLGGMKFNVSDLKQSQVFSKRLNVLYMLKILNKLEERLNKTKTTKPLIKIEVSESTKNELRSDNSKINQALSDIQSTIDEWSNSKWERDFEKKLSERNFDINETQYQSELKNLRDELNAVKQVIINIQTEKTAKDLTDKPLDGSINTVQGWDVGGYVDNGKAGELKGKTMEECRIAAKNHGYKAWGYRNHNHGDMKNTCFFYDDRFIGFAGKVDKIHTTGCVNAGEQVKWGCSTTDPELIRVAINNAKQNASNALTEAEGYMKKASDAKNSADEFINQINTAKNEITSIADIPNAVSSEENVTKIYDLIVEYFEEAKTQRDNANTHNETAKNATTSTDAETASDNAKKAANKAKEQAELAEENLVILQTATNNFIQLLTTGGSGSSGVSSDGVSGGVSGGVSSSSSGVISPDKEYTPGELTKMYNKRKQEINDDIKLVNYFIKEASTFEKMALKDTELFDDILTKRVEIAAKKLEMTAIISAAQENNLTLDEEPLNKKCDSISLSQEVIDSLDAESINLAKSHVSQNIEFLQNLLKYYLNN